MKPVNQLPYPHRFEIAHMSRCHRISIALIIGVLMFGTAAPVLAHSGFGPEAGDSFAVLGLDTGITNMNGAHFFLGAEISANLFIVDNPWVWAGAFADFTAITQDGGFHGDYRYAVGPQMGIFFWGLEFGFLGERFDGNGAVGFRAAFVFTLGFVAAYIRWGHLQGAPAESDYGEGGILLKIPLRLN